MPSLKSSLKKLRFNDDQIEYVMLVYQQHRDEGLSGKDAVDATIKELEGNANEQIRDVSKQINEGRT